MAGTFAIAQFTADPAHGPYTFGPQSLAPNDAKIVLSVDRTPAGGLNSLDPSVSVHIQVDQSNDGGTTWFLAVAADCPGGLILAAPPPRNDGLPLPVSTVTVAPYGSGPGRQLRATLTASGALVVIAGTVTVT